MDEIKERYAEKLARRAETAVKVIKILFFCIIAVAAVIVIYTAVIAGTGFIKTDTAAALAALLSLAGVLAALSVAVAAAFITAQISLDRLKRLK